MLDTKRKAEAKTILVDSDESSDDFWNDYATALALMLNSAHLRLNGMFDMSLDLMKGGAINIPDSVSTIFLARLRLQAVANKEIQVLAEYARLECPSKTQSKWIFPVHNKVHYSDDDPRKRPLDMLLSDDCGGVSDEIKAVSLVVQVDPRKVGEKWLFNPTWGRGGAILRTYGNSSFDMPNRASRQSMLSRRNL